MATKVGMNIEVVILESFKKNANIITLSNDCPEEFSLRMKVYDLEGIFAEVGTQISVDGLLNLKNAIESILNSLPEDKDE